MHLFDRPPLARSTVRFWLILVLISVAEFLTAAVEPQVGLIIHTLLLVGLIAGAALAPDESDRRLALALALMPLIRLLSLALPLNRLPRMAWYPVVSIPLLIATWSIVRQFDISWRDLGLRSGTLSLQLALAMGGLGVGALEYLILRPEPQYPTFSWAVFLLSSFSLVLFTGFSEELIFRALLQRLVLPVLGRSGILYVSVLFGVMHIGYLSVPDVLFVASMGLLFAQLGRWSGSIFGITLAHGMSNITLFLVLPVLSSQLGSALIPIIAALALVGILSFVIVSGILTLQQRVWQPPAQATSDIRALRRDQGIRLIDLASRTGLASRRVLEIEQGLAMPHPDELRLVGIALGNDSLERASSS